MRLQYLIMVTAKSQARWRDRVAKGLVSLNPICPICQKKCRSDTKKRIEIKGKSCLVHHKCWLKTDEGRKYLAQKKQESRNRSEANDEGNAKQVRDPNISSSCS